MTKTILFTSFIAFALSLSASNTEQTWEGKISDSACGEFHKVDRTHSKHLSDRDCTLDRVREGARYILVSHGKIYQIQNQNFPGLKEYAGRKVKVQGDVTENDTIIVTDLSRP
jgi:hypothetical protein